MFYPIDFLSNFFNLNLTLKETRRAEHEYMNLLYTQALDMSYFAI